VFALTVSIERHYPALCVAAGDTFLGGFAAALAAGRSAPEASGYGQAAAALSVTRRGARPSIPCHGEIVMGIGDAIGTIVEG